MEIKETKKTVPNAYITRLASNIQAFAKKFDKKQEVVEKYLEKKLGKGIKDFSMFPFLIGRIRTKKKICYKKKNLRFHSS